MDQQFPSLQNEESQNDAVFHLFKASNYEKYPYYNSDWLYHFIPPFIEAVNLISSDSETNNYDDLNQLRDEFCVLFQQYSTEVDLTKGKHIGAQGRVKPMKYFQFTLPEFAYSPDFLTSLIKLFDLRFTYGHHDYYWCFIRYLFLKNASANLLPLLEQGLMDQITFYYKKLVTVFQQAIDTKNEAVADDVVNYIDELFGILSDFVFVFYSQKNFEALDLIYTSFGDNFIDNLLSYGYYTQCGLARFIFYLSQSESPLINEKRRLLLRFGKAILCDSITKNEHQNIDIKLANYGCWILHYNFKVLPDISHYFYQEGIDKYFKTIFDKVKPTNDYYYLLVHVFMVLHDTVSQNPNFQPQDLPDPSSLGMIDLSSIPPDLSPNDVNVSFVPNDAEFESESDSHLDDRLMAISDLHHFEDYDGLGVKSKVDKLHEQFFFTEFSYRFSKELLPYVIKYVVKPIPDQHFRQSLTQPDIQSIEGENPTANEEEEMYSMFQAAEAEAKIFPGEPIRYNPKLFEYTASILSSLLQVDDENQKNSIIIALEQDKTIQHICDVMYDININSSVTFTVKLYYFDLIHDCFEYLHDLPYKLILIQTHNLISICADMLECGSHSTQNSALSLLQSIWEFKDRIKPEIKEPDIPQLFEDAGIMDILFLDQNDKFHFL